MGTIFNHISKIFLVSSFKLEKLKIKKNLEFFNIKNQSCYLLSNLTINSSKIRVLECNSDAAIITIYEYISGILFQKYEFHNIYFNKGTFIHTV